MILPNSKVRLHAYIPLDAGYENTILFKSLSAQTAYFNNAEYEFDGLQYVRSGTNSIKLNIKPEVAMLNNYMSFQNKSYGNKWFYAFIVQVDYVNDNTSEITFELDYMQTYHFDYTLPMCFVEREMPINNVAGTNYQAEPFDIGNIVCTQCEKDSILNSFVAIIASSVHIDPLTHEKTPGAGVYGGMVQGVDMSWGPPVTNTNYQSAVAQLKSTIAYYTQYNAVDSIVSIFIMPQAFMGKSDGSMSEYTVTRQKQSSLDGYVPKNKKLLQYPYCYLAVDTGANCANYRYEWFSSSNPTFKMVGTYSCNPEVSLIPHLYNGALDNYPEQLKLGGFGQLAFSVDTYKAWLAQNADGYNLRLQSAQITANTATINSAGNFVSSLFSANPASAIPAMINGTTNTLQAQIGLKQVENDLAVQQNQAPHARGQQQTMLDVVQGSKGFWFKNMSMTAENAKIADDYLSMFGWATNQVKRPNRTSGLEWNYVKTCGMYIYGSLPNEAALAIAKIYDKGVRFWHNPDNVGHYSLSNF